MYYFRCFCVCYFRWFQVLSNVEPVYTLTACFLTLLPRVNISGLFPSLIAEKYLMMAFICFLLIAGEAGHLHLSFGHWISMNYLCMLLVCFHISILFFVFSTFLLKSICKSSLDTFYQYMCHKHLILFILLCFCIYLLYQIYFKFVVAKIIVFCVWFCILLT